MKLSLNEQSKKQVFKQLYEEYYAPFCLYAKRFVDNKETREDIVSEVFRLPIGTTWTTSR